MVDYNTIIEKVKHVPGLIVDGDIKAMCEIASRLPRNNVLIEVGCLFGKSTCAWAEMLDEYTIYAVDMFLIDMFLNDINQEKVLLSLDLVTQEIFNDFNQTGKTHLEYFKEYTSTYANIIPVVARSDYAAIDSSLPRPMCIFEDADHTEFSLRSLPDWWDRLLPGGILCGHDYDAKFQPVINAVTSLSNKTKAPITLYKNSSVWSIKKPN